MQVLGFTAVTVRAFAEWVLFYIVLRNIPSLPFEAWVLYHVGVIGSAAAWLLLSVLDVNGDGAEPVA